VAGNNYDGAVLRAKGKGVMCLGGGDESWGGEGGGGEGGRGLFPPTLSRKLEGEGLTLDAQL